MELMEVIDPVAFEEWISRRFLGASMEELKHSPTETDGECSD